MTPIEQIIEEFNEKFPHYPKDPIYGEENARERKRMIDFLTSLQESTESRVREELRAAVEKVRMVLYAELDDDPPEGEISTGTWINEQFEALLQDPKKQ